MEIICKHIDIFFNRDNYIDFFYMDQKTLDYFIKPDWCGINHQFNFQKHIKFTKNIENAKLIIKIAPSTHELKLVNDLLEKTIIKDKFYLILIRVGMDKNRELLNLPILSMKNVYFFTFDLRDHILTDDNIKPLQGVTIPSPYKYENYILNNSNNTKKYIFSFKGNCNQHGYYNSCGIRQKLKNLCKNNDTQYKFLYEDTTDRNISRDRKIYMNILAESTYGLVLHGDGRWSHRLIEVMGSGAIPILVSDGLTLPFEQIINYENALIKINEKEVFACNTVSDFIKLLPENDIMEQYKNNARNIYNNFFYSNKTIMELLLVCVKLEYNQLYD